MFGCFLLNWEDLCLNVQEGLGIGYPGGFGALLRDRETVSPRPAGSIT